MAYVLKLETGMTLKLDDLGLSVEAVGAEPKRLTDTQAMGILFNLASQMKLDGIVPARKQAQDSLLQLLHYHDWEGLSVIVEAYGDALRLNMELERAARTHEHREYAAEPEEELSEEERLEQMEGMDQDDEEEDDEGEDLDMDNQPCPRCREILNYVDEQYFHCPECGYQIGGPEE